MKHLTEDELDMLMAIRGQEQRTALFMLLAGVALLMLVFSC